MGNRFRDCYTKEELKILNLSLSQVEEEEGQTDA